MGTRTEPVGHETRLDPGQHRRRERSGLAGRDLCFGTVDSWVAWTLSGGAGSGGSLHVSDQTNASAATSALRLVDGSDWNDAVLDAFAIPRSILPDVVDSVGVCGLASALPGAPPIAGILGDQQASLVGQSCVVAGRAKVTFGTGGMLDLCTDAGTPVAADRTAAGTFPLPLWSRDGVLTWGVEGIMLSAGTNIEWLRDDLGIIGTSAESHDVAQGCATSDGVVYVPALLGLGTPHWDYGARGTLLGITRGTERSHVVRAVLEGIAHRGADLIDAADDRHGRRHHRGADRRRYERESDVRASVRRCRRPADRGVADRRVDHDRGRVHGRSRCRRVRRDGRSRRSVASGPCGRADSGDRPRRGCVNAGSTRQPLGGLDTRTLARSTSEDRVSRAPDL